MGDLRPRLLVARRGRSRGQKWSALVAMAVVALATIAISACSPARTQANASNPGNLPRQVPVFPASSLAPSHGALFGAWVQPASWVGAYTEQSAVAAFEHAIGRKLAIDQLYVSWGGEMPVAVAGWDLQHGIVPMISWDGAPSNLITEGAYDIRIRAVAQQLKSLHGPVMLRWSAEMDLGKHRSQTISPAGFVAAWRHMHAIFSSVGRPTSAGSGVPARQPSPLESRRPTIPANPT